MSESQRVKTDDSGAGMVLCFGYGPLDREADLFRIGPSGIKLIVRRENWVTFVAFPDMRHSAPNDAPWTFGVYCYSVEYARELEQNLSAQASAIRLFCGGAIRSMFAAQGDALHAIGIGNNAIHGWANVHAREITLISPPGCPHKVFHVEPLESHVFPTTPVGGVNSGHGVAKQGFSE